MSGNSTIVTLLPRSLAKKGKLFVNEGEMPECRRCPLRNVCMGNPKPGRVYRVIGVRRKTHKCPVYGEVVVVEAEEAEFELALEPRHVVVGAIITYTPLSCPEKLCPNRMLCVPSFVKERIKIKILEDRGELRCPRGLRLRKVLVKTVD